MLSALFAVFVFAGWTSAASASTFAWSGTHGSSADWSVGDNWGGGTAPLASDSGDSLIFPADLTGGDCETTQNDACYAPTDDLPGYSIDGLTIDDGVGYKIGGTDALTIGAGGISATTSSSTFNPSQIGTPIALGGSQTWSVDGGGNQQGELITTGGISGQAQPLDLSLSNTGFLALASGSANEVGQVTVTGSEPGEYGVNAVDNGAVELQGGATLNDTDGSTTDVVDAELLGNGTIGPVTSTSGLVTAGDPLGTLAVDGALTLGSESALGFSIGASGTTPGTDYSQLTTTGNVDLVSSNLDITGIADDNACPALGLGNVYTLLSTTGTITGTFSNVPYTDDIGMDCNDTYGPPEPLLSIAYTTHTITATVVGPAAVTDTTLAVAPDAFVSGQPVTLTAVANVQSNNFGWVVAQGNVDFEDNGAAIAGCTAVGLESVSVNDQYGGGRATCTLTAGAAGQYGFQAVFVSFFPVTGGEFDSSSPVISGEIGAAPPTPATPLVASAGTVSAHGGAASLLLTCPSNAAGGSCAITDVLSSTETLKGDKVIAVDAEARSKSKTRKRGITIGSSSTFLAAGQADTLTVSLNSTGRELLKSRDTLPAVLTVTSDGTVISRQVVRFQAKKKPKR